MSELQTLIPVPHHLPAYKAILTEIKRYPIDSTVADFITGVWESLQIEGLNDNTDSVMLTQLTDELCRSFEYHKCSDYPDENDMYAAIDVYFNALCDNIITVSEYYRPYVSLVNYGSQSVPTVTRVWPTVALITIDEASLCTTPRTNT